MDELSNVLQDITGSSGKNSFDTNEFYPGGIFVVAFDDNNEPIGCGSIRKIEDNDAEVKRMYAKHIGLGIGSEVINYLEKKAKSMGYLKLILETRLINQKAVSFYKKQGYSVIDNYGKYQNNSEAICFEKIL